MSVYQYKPLDQSQPSIRLLKVLPGTWKDPIQIEIHNAHRGKRPEYVALSYSWETNSGQGLKSVKCSGAKIKVGRNLWDFLRRFRASNLVRRTKLWIDALCIDQINVSERNHQVSQMSEIYADAKSVITWLGETTDAEQEELAYEIASSGPDWSLEHEPSKRIYAAMAHLLDKHYWSRMWVVQEFILAPEVDLWWGAHTTNVNNIRGWVNDLLPPETPGYQGFFTNRRSWAYSSWGAKLAWDTTGRKLLQYRQKSRAEAAYEESTRNPSRPRTQKYQGPKLREWLVEFDQSGCREKVDKVYALLGIASDVSLRRDLIPVDYNKSSFEVLLDILRFQHKYNSGDSEGDLGWVISVSRRLGVVRGDLARYIFRQSLDVMVQTLAFGVAVRPTVSLRFIGTILRHERTKKTERELTAEDREAFGKFTSLPEIENLSLETKVDAHKCWPHNSINETFSIARSRELVGFLTSTLESRGISKARPSDPELDAQMLEQLSRHFFGALDPCLAELTHEICHKTAEFEKFVARAETGELVYGTSQNGVGDAQHLAVLETATTSSEVLLLDPLTPGYPDLYNVRGITRLLTGSAEVVVDRDKEEVPQEVNNQPIPLASDPRSKHLWKTEARETISDSESPKSQPTPSLPPASSQSQLKSNYSQIQLSNCDWIDLIDLTRRGMLDRNELLRILKTSWDADAARPQRRFGLSVHENRILEDWFALQGRESAK